MQLEHANYHARVWEISNFVTKCVQEFEVVFEDRELKERLSSAQVVYLHEIIINLWMILGDSRNDKYTLTKINTIFDNQEIRDIAEAVLTDHEALIAKLKSNRNWISAHIDERLTGLKFSEETIKEFEKRFHAKIPQMRAANRGNERYTPDDLRRDLPEIRKILFAMRRILNLIPRACIP